MLQQTQTSRVINHFTPFVNRFPNVNSLAIADRKDILSMWSGLGYYRRAVALHRTAAVVTRRFNGRVPQDTADLRSLPGVGPATTGAVQAFGFGLPAVFVETNIRRAALHEFYPNRKQISDRELLPLLEKALDRSDPRRWYWALMDYGAFLARTIPNPNRRSAHYSQQRSFEGSNRQQRGNILKILANKGPLHINDLISLIEADNHSYRQQTTRNLDTMRAEGLIDIDTDVVMLASGQEDPE
jgi:A/G-specific adenine glycosylase